MGWVGRAAPACSPPRGPAATPLGHGLCKPETAGRLCSYGCAAGAAGSFWVAGSNDGSPPRGSAPAPPPWPRVPVSPTCAALPPLPACPQHDAALPAGRAERHSGGRLQGSHIHDHWPAGIARHLHSRPGHGCGGWLGARAAARSGTDSAHLQRAASHAGACSPPDRAVLLLDCCRSLLLLLLRCCCCPAQPGLPAADDRNTFDRERPSGPLSGNHLTVCIP